MFISSFSNLKYFDKFIILVQIVGGHYQISTYNCIKQNIIDNISNIIIGTYIKFEWKNGMRKMYIMEIFHKSFSFFSIFSYIK